MLRLENVILGPVLSEKAVGRDDVYTLKVDDRASKEDVRRALKKYFDVDVVKLNALITRSKTKRRMRHKGSQSAVNVTPRNVKKVFVRLRSGQTLPTPVLANDSAATAQQAQA